MSSVLGDDRTVDMPSLAQEKFAPTSLWENVMLYEAVFSHAVFAEDTSWQKHQVKSTGTVLPVNYLVSWMLLYSRHTVYQSVVNSAFLGDS